MSLIDTLDPILQPWAWKLFAVAEAAGVRPRVTSGRRSTATQNQLYIAFLRGHSHYPAAPPGLSAHEYGLAFDMLVEGSVNQSDCGIVWRSWGGRYGSEEDPIHFEYPNWRTVAGVAHPISQTPPPTADSISRKIYQLADEIALGVPSPLRGILNTGIIANALFHYLGVNPYGQGVEWMLTHPAELTTALLAAARRVYLGAQ